MRSSVLFAAHLITPLWVTAVVAVILMANHVPDEELLLEIKAWGSKVISTATTVEEALWLEAHGADAIIAQGLEAGGHRGHFLSEDLTEQLGTFSLLPQVIAAVDIPVIAAGGIVDVATVRAAMTMGASAVQVGTAYLLCPECNTSAIHREALQSDAAIGALDAALAVQGAGLASFKDIGNMSIEEIDVLADILVRKQKEGHFAAFWSDDEEAAQLMLSPSIDIQSLWSPTLMRLHRAGVKYRLAVPREGYRAWFGGLSLSRHAQGPVLDAAYAYLNWWLSGWPGAVMARQGYYIGNPARSRDHLSSAEWDYWYAGKPAREELLGSDGLPLIDIGEVRDGGSYEQRMGHIAVWNSVMDEHNYLVRRWGDFMRARGA
jgi:hypothetical protein